MKKNQPITKKKLYYGTDKCILANNGDSNYISHNYDSKGLYTYHKYCGSPHFKLYEERDDAIIDAAFDFIDRGDYILAGHDVWNFDRIVYECVSLAFREITETISWYEDSPAFIETKEIIKKHKLALAKKFMKTGIIDKPESNKKAVMGYLEDVIEELVEQHCGVYDLYDAEAYYEEYTTINELGYMLKDGKYAEAQKYVAAREKEHKFTLDDHLFHQETQEFNRDLILDEKFVQEKLLPAIDYYESMSCQSSVVTGAINRLATIRDILENNKRALHWKYMDMKLGDVPHHHGFDPVVLEVDIELKNPYSMDATNPKFKENGARYYKEQMGEARRKKHDGVVFLNSTLDGFKRTEYIVFSHEQIKEHGKKRKISSYAVAGNEK